MSSFRHPPLLPFGQPKFLKFKSIQRRSSKRFSCSTFNEVKADLLILVRSLALHRRIAQLKHVGSEGKAQELLKEIEKAADEFFQ